MRPLLKFGLPLAGASILVFAIGYADQLVAGGTLGATALGFYVLAFNLSSWPQQIFSQPLRNVAPATFARLQHEPEAMRSAFRSIIGLLAAVTFPSACCSPARPSRSSIRLRQCLGACRRRIRVARRSRGVQDPVRVRLRLSGGGRRVARDLGGATRNARRAGARADRWRNGFAISGVAAAEVFVAACVALPLYLSCSRGLACRPGSCSARLWLPVLIAAASG